METKIIKFCNCYILRNHQIIKEDILVRDGKFLNPEPLFFDEKRKPDKVVNCKGLLIAPGLIDLQINGAFGFDFSHDIRDETSSKKCLEQVAKGLLKYGMYVCTNSLLQCFSKSFVITKHSIILLDNDIIKFFVKRCNCVFNTYTVLHNLIFLFETDLSK